MKEGPRTRTLVDAARDAWERGGVTLADRLLAAVEAERACPDCGHKSGAHRDGCIAGPRTALCRCPRQFCESCEGQGRIRLSEGEGAACDACDATGTADATGGPTDV